LITWNNDDTNVSYFNIYRALKGNLELVADENLIGTVSNSSSVFFNYIDLNLEINRDYIYTVVAVSKFGKNSLYNGNIYIGFDNTSLSTKNLELAILQPSTFVEPLSSVGLSSTLPGSWSFQENNSGSILTEKDSMVEAIYQANDSWGAEDIIKIESDDQKSFSKVIITEVI
jgi:hypothetical protein